MRERILEALAVAIAGHRKTTAIVTAVVFLACVAWLGTGHLGFETSRHAIVNADDPEQMKLEAYSDRFGAVNDVVVVLSGADSATLRAAVDAVAPKLQAIDGIDEVFYRVAPDALGQQAIWYLGAERLERARNLLSLADEASGNDAKLPPIRGIGGALTQLNDALESFVDGEIEFGDGARKLDEETLKGGVAMAAGLLDEATTWIEEPDRDRFTLEERATARGGGIGLDELGYLVGPHGDLFILRVGSDRDLIDNRYARPIVAGLRATLAEHVPSGVDWGITGVPVMVVEEQEAMERDMPLTASLSVVGCLLIFFLAYRSLRATALILAPLLVGMSLALGFTSVSVGHLNLLTSVMVVILVGMGIDFGVHLLTRIRHEHAAGTPEPVRAAMAATGPAILTGALTSAAAFATLMITGFSSLEELGLIASLGLLSMLLAAFVVLPLWLSRDDVTFETSQLDDRLERFALPKSAAWPLLIGSLAATVALGSKIEPIEFDLDLSIMLPEDTMSRRTLEMMQERGTGGFEYGVLLPDTLSQLRERQATVDGLAEGLVLRTESVLDVLPTDLDAADPILAELRRLATKLPPPPFEPAEVEPKPVRDELVRLLELLRDDLPFTLKTLGREDLVDELEPLTRAATRLEAAARAADDSTLKARLTAFQSRAAELEGRVRPALLAAHERLSPAHLPEELTAPWYRADDSGEYFALRVYPKGDPADPTYSQRFRDALRDIDSEATGYAVTYAHFGRLMQDGFKTAALWAAVVVFFLVLLDLRSLKGTLLALLPLAMGGIWMVGLMNVFGIGYSFANVVSIPLIIGIGIDSGIHLIHRWREANSDTNEALRSTGRAILVSSLTTSMAFGALLLSAHAGSASLGLTLLIGVSCCMVTALVSLPAVLLLLSE